MLQPPVALATLQAALRRPGSVVLVDGRSGSGKTTFAAALSRIGGARLLRLDDVYPGWSGLDAASRTLVDRVLLPRSAGAPGRFLRWDWGNGVPGEEVVVPADRSLVVEGCGALSRAAARFATATAWVELGDGERRERALDRDGAAYRPWWDLWAGQERAFLAREDPRRLAEVVVDGRRFAASLFSAPTGDVQYPRRP